MSRKSTSRESLQVSIKYPTSEQVPIYTPRRALCFAEEISSGHCQGPPLAWRGFLRKGCLRTAKPTIWSQVVGYKLMAYVLPESAFRLLSSSVLIETAYLNILWVAHILQTKVQSFIYILIQSSPQVPFWLSHESVSMNPVPWFLEKDNKHFFF